MDTFPWGPTAGDLLRAVPEHELSRLTSLRPRLRAVLASDPRCSGPAMLLLTGDTDRVRRALAANPAAGPRVKELLWAIEFTVLPLHGPVSDTLRLLSRTAQPDEPWWGVRLPPRPDPSFVFDRFIGDPHCRPELLRVLWRDQRMRPVVVHHPHPPEDLMGEMLTDADPQVCSAAVERFVRSRRRRPELILVAVRDPGNGLSARDRAMLLARVPWRHAAAARDASPTMRETVASVTRSAAILRDLSQDSDEAVRAAAGRRLLQLLSG